MKNLILFFCCYILSFSAFGSISTEEVAFTIPKVNRQIVAQIYYPTTKFCENIKLEIGIWKREKVIESTPLPDKKNYPLVIFSHGFQGDRFGNSWLAEELVAAGFIVAMIEHTHNTSYDHNDFFTFSSIWQRPKDMSALLTFLLESKKWGKIIDQKQIAATGFSLGGVTALWLGGIETDSNLLKAEMDKKYSRWTDWPKHIKEEGTKVNWSKGNLSYYDKRFKAIVAIAPDLGAAFLPAGLNKGVTQALIIGADNDQITPLKNNAVYFAKHIPGAELYTIKDAEHFSFMNECSELGLKITPFLCSDSERRPKLHTLAAKKIKDFLLKAFNNN